MRKQFKRVAALLLAASMFGSMYMLHQSGVLLKRHRSMKMMDLQG